MWRALIFIFLIGVIAAGAVWLADQPGDVVLTLGDRQHGSEYAVSLAVGAIGLILFSALLIILWSAGRFILSIPDRLTYASRARRRAKGYTAMSRGMIAVGAGDPAAARRFAGEAERLLGREPLALLLKAQAAQVSGDRPAAEAAFRRMAEHAETRVLGLRGLFVEARRRGDAAAARDYAREAARLAPAVAWANEAVLEAHCAERDWAGALRMIERRNSAGLLDKAVARRQRAVLLTAEALESADTDPERALARALDAVRLAPDLVPAAALAGRLLSLRGDLRRAAKIVETAWKANPHPDLAAAYLALRPGDSAKDRLARAETLARLSSWDPEARLALARAALDAREFRRARDTVRPLIEERPSVRVCLLMADLEQAEHGTTGRVREWLARAARAPRDPAWISDGLVSDRWAPASPLTGRLDAFVWQVPPEMLGAPGGAIVDDVLADLDEEEAPPALAAPLPAPEPPAVAAPPEPAAPEPPLVPTQAPLSATTPPPAPASEEPPEVAAAAEATAPPAAAAETGTEPRKSGEAGTAREAGAEPAPVVFPVAHAPDDPGTDSAETKRPRFRLIG